MNDLLFYAIIIALFYYFWVYLPKQQASKPLIHTSSTQTETVNSNAADDVELTHALTSLLQHLQTFNRTI